MSDAVTRCLPTKRGPYFLTDGGMETTLVFHEGVELPNFAAFVLIDTDEGQTKLWDYYERYLPIALENKVNFILETPTWRASPDWGAATNYTLGLLGEANRACVALMQNIRAHHQSPGTEIAISGCVGPRGDGYKVGEKMSAQEAKAYHTWQIKILRDACADFVTAMTMNYSEEAVGIVEAAKGVGIPSVISFTVETDGRLPSGETLEQAIMAVEAATDGAPLYYMINCAHPSHFDSVLEANAPWVDRIWGVRANASRCSHEELDNATELDSGDPVDLGQRYKALCDRLPNLRVLGGCCGTDHRHVQEISKACFSSLVTAQTD